MTRLSGKKAIVTGGVYTAMHGSDFISEEEASYSTGSEFIADGGWSAGLVEDALPMP